MINSLQNMFKIFFRSGWWWVYLILILVNGVFFLGHYLGTYDFPFDFRLAYHAMPYALYADGSLPFFQTWNPYGNYGYPNVLNIQNGGYYLPLVIIDFLDITYTLHVAVILQCLHILWGSIGMYHFLRQQGFSALAGCFGAIAYHCSSGFFSNAQHVDIIIGYAWLPWLLLSLSPQFLNQRSRIIATAIILWCFIAGSYIGIIVSSVYALILWTLYQIIIIHKYKQYNLSKYIVYLFASGLIALCLSLPKYLSALLMRDEFFSYGHSSGVHWSQWLTLWWRFDIESFVHITANAEAPTWRLEYLLNFDPTMRSLYIIPTVFILIMMIKKGGPQIRFALLLLLLAISVLAGDLPMREWLLQLPGMTISRFHASDWRGWLHIALIILAAAGWDSLWQRRLSLFEINLRSIVLILMIGVLAGISLYSGWTIRFMKAELIAMAIIVLAVAIGYYGIIKHYGNLYRYCVGIFWLFLSVLSAWFFHAHYKITWQPEVTNSTAFDGVDPRVLQHRQKVFLERPARINSVPIGLPPYSPDAQRMRMAGIQAYYTQEFSAGSYDNGLRLKRIFNLFDTYIYIPEFLQQPSHAVFLTALNQKALLNALAAGPVLPLATAKMRQFGLSSSEQWVYNPSDQDVWMVENELYFPGWQGLLCQEELCSSLEASEAPLSLRAWLIPPGEYILKSFYQPPGYQWGIRLFFIGVLLWLVLVAEQIYYLLRYYIQKAANFQKVNQ